jgi:hypothetical protein
MGTTIMSWKIKMASAVRPWGLSISALSWSSFSTIAVLLKEMRKLMKIDSLRGSPIFLVIIKQAPYVKTPWSVPPMRRNRLIRKRLFKENSIPIVKRSNMTPISANVSTSATELINPNPWGPTTMPVRRNPTMAGIRKRWNKKRTMVARISIITKSFNKGACMSIALLMNSKIEKSILKGNLGYVFL